MVLLRPEAHMLFYESFFPVVWIVFVLYWQIKAADTKSHPASRARSLAHPPRPHLPDRDRFTLDTSHPAALALRPALAAELLAILAGSRPHRRRPSLRRLGARAPRPQLEPLRHH